MRTLNAAVRARAIARHMATSASEAQVRFHLETALDPSHVLSLASRQVFRESRPTSVYSQ
jgi:hypothetical protein